MKVTNNSRAVQGVHHLGGVAYVKPGETKDLVLSKSQAKRADRMSFIDVDGDPVDDPVLTAAKRAGEGKDGVYIPASEFNGLRTSFDALREENETLRKRLAELEGGAPAAKTVAEVLALADGGTHFKTFEAEAKKILGDATPATKEDIVAALKAKQTA